jgi:hypothetical protein
MKGATATGVFTARFPAVSVQECTGTSSAPPAAGAVDHPEWAAEIAFAEGL